MPGSSEFNLIYLFTRTHACTHTRANAHAHAHSRAYSSLAAGVYMISEKVGQN